MKIDRLLSIIIYLLNHQKVRAQVLADKFEVSLRTIYRDIEAIGQAGIPIVTYPGGGGGLAIMDGFKLDKSVLSREEMLSVITGLKGINSINPDVRTRLLIEKFSGLSAESNNMSSGPELVIDLSPWNKYDQLGTMIEEIKKAVRNRQIMEFLYITGQNITRRRVEPQVIVFKQSNWYLYAFCLLRQDFRLFKLKRIYELALCNEFFHRRDFSLDEINWDDEAQYAHLEPVVVAFDPQMKYAVRDIFGPDNIETLDDGRIKVSFPGQGNDWLYGFLLSFGYKVEVLSPDEVRNSIKLLTQKILAIYQ
ncbi:MAG: YafY family protein [Syntrophomonas sp.]